MNVAMVGEFTGYLMISREKVIEIVKALVRRKRLRLISRILRWEGEK